MLDLGSRAFGLFAVLFFLVSSVLLMADDGSQSGPKAGKSPLDLPLPGNGADDPDEDAPEVILFYGTEYEGDAFFWCLDRSCSMSWYDGLPMETLKTEMTGAIESLSSQAEFGIVAYNHAFSRWQAEPRKATRLNKGSAIQWIDALSGIGTTCIAPPMVAVLEIANQTRRRRPQVILVSDGVPECPPPFTSAQATEVLEAIDGANYRGFSIHTIFIHEEPTPLRPEGMELTRLIAAQNSGTFKDVGYWP